MAEIKDLPRVAAIATIPGRIDTFKEVLLTIRPQVDHVFVYLDGYPELPDFLQGMEAVTIRRAEDVGNMHASSRFLCLAELKGPAVVAIVDDDIFYPPKYIDRLVHALEVTGGEAIVGVHGRTFLPPHRSYVHNVATFYFAHALSEFQHVHELGTGTCAFVSDRFNIDPREWAHTNVNDLIVAIEAEKRGLARIVIPRPAKWLQPSRAAESDSLWMRVLQDESLQCSLMRELLALYAEQPALKPATRSHANRSLPKRA